MSLCDWKLSPEVSVIRINIHPSTKGAAGYELSGPQTVVGKMTLRGAEVCLVVPLRFNRRHEIAMVCVYHKVFLKII